MLTDALTDAEKAAFTTLDHLMAEQFDNVRPALMRATLGGRDVAVVVAVHDADEDGVRVDPLAVLVDTVLLLQLTPPEGAEPVSAAD